MDAAMRFDHLGLVVRTLAEGRNALSAGLMIQEWTQEFQDPVNGVYIQFGRDPAGVVYELLEPLDEKSPVYHSLKSRKNLLNHVAYCVASFDEHCNRLEVAGYAPISEPKPAIAYGGRRVQFFYSPVGMIIELIDALDHEHAYNLVASEFLPPCG